MTARAFATHGNRPTAIVLGAVALGRLRLGEPDAGDLRVGVDRPRNRRRLAHLGLVPRRVLGCDLAFAEGGVRELPVAGDVARGVDVRDGGAPVRVGPDPVRGVERHARCLEPDALDERRTADRDEHQVALDGLALAEVDDEPGARVLDLRALLAEVDDDPAPRERLAQLARRVRVLLRDERVEHLDHRHLGAEALEDRGELAADDPAAEHDEPLRDLGLREESRRVDAARRLEPGIGGVIGYEPVATIALLKLTPMLALVEDDRPRVLEAPAALEPRRRCSP